MFFAYTACFHGRAETLLSTVFLERQDQLQDFWDSVQKEHAKIIQKLLRI